MNANKGITRSEVIVILLCGALLFIGLTAIGDTGRDRAKVILCQSNLKQLYRANNEFLADNDYVFPDSYRWYMRRTVPGAANSLWCNWHNRMNSPIKYPKYAGQLWPYLENMDVFLCPAFNRLATSGWGEFHYRHNPNVPMDPQFTYSMNGYLGPGRFGVAKKRGLVVNPGRTFIFTEENLWTIKYRSAVSAVISNYNFVARLSYHRSDDPKDYTPDLYNGGIATYHNVPSQSLDLVNIDDAYYASQEGINYPTWGLCRGGGNAVFLDGHVELVPSNQDPFEISWPLAGPIIPSPWYSDLK